ncbi:MAG: nucleotide pyrophosphohydrolase [Candidatus Marsarchaeota archaeon]|nr:nucleotide pyrophosphohydrolase [Candidatus Marsarchaeota archaeon]
MDDNATVSDMKDLVKAFCDARDWGQYHNAKDLAIGVATESAELLDNFRFKSVPESDLIMADPGKRKKVEDEMADVLYFLLRLSERYGIDMSEALNSKMAQNEAKYPISKSRGSNKKYDEL